MTKRAPGLYFDPADYELVDLVNKRVGQDSGADPFSRLFDPYLHPRGIKELAAPSQRRIAYAVIQLLETLEAGRAEERLAALRSLRDEVLNNSSSSLRRNTARVLLAIMKELVRERGHEERQIRLAHDFFAALSGRPTVIRRELRRYHLLEMPEDWNQVAFDHHVHDAHTKGRKSPTHLITDAWIKGIRDLNVIYYNFIRPEAAAELTEAAEMMGVQIRIGIEVSACFHGKYVQFIWTPRGYSGREDFLEFLTQPEVQRFFSEGLEVAAYRKKVVLALLDSFNEHHLTAIRETYGLALDPLDPEQFMRFVGVGQASVAHLAEYIYHLLLPGMRERVLELQASYRDASPEERKRILEEMEALNHLLPEQIAGRYLRSEVNPGIPSAKVFSDADDVPALLKLSPTDVVNRLSALRTGYRLTLNPTNLSAAEVLELLYDLEGAVTHIEIFNLKDRRQGRDVCTPQLARLRRILNSGSPIALKHAIVDIIREVEASADPNRDDRLNKLHKILGDIPRLTSFYRNTTLRSRIGSDSIGRAGALYGMGLVVRDTLPLRAQREIDHQHGGRETIPVHIEAQPLTRWTPRVSTFAFMNRIYGWLRLRPVFRKLAYEDQDTFVVNETETRLSPQGNVVTLGGVDAHPGNGFSVEPETSHKEKLGWRYLNTSWKNALKVAIGFLPAFLTFFLTKEWWVLAWFGAPIWFTITGLRNVLQSVVAGGGLYRSSLIRWNNLVSWERVTDSLLYTGFSVPLLDWLVKREILDFGLGINTTTSPILLYTIIALANGTYLATHNTIRGLPRAAVVGNFFRALLSIPLALLFNGLIFSLLMRAGVAEAAVLAMLQNTAAIIAKAASDVVAGIIEGSADRAVNMRTRRMDFRTKLTQVLEIHGRLETLLPETNVLEMLSSPKELIRTVGNEAEQLQRRLIINALDLMYFWMYQPRARSVLRGQLSAATPEERQIILGAQRVLERERQITQMFLDHLVGKRFARSLSFYLDKWSTYLADLDRLAVSFQLPAAAHETQTGPIMRVATGR